MSLTPKQFYLIVEKMRIRRHNDRAMQYHLHNFKIKGTRADFIDPEHEKHMSYMEEEFIKEALNMKKFKEEHEGLRNGKS